MKTTDNCFCELCLRYGVKTKLHPDYEVRTFEVENRKDLAEFPVCDACAEQIDSDTRKPGDR